MKKITMYILISIMFVSMSNVAIGAVHSGERVTKKEVAKYFGKNWQRGDFTGGKLWDELIISSAGEAYIQERIKKNKKVQELVAEGIATFNEIIPTHK